MDVLRLFSTVCLAITVALGMGIDDLVPLGLNESLAYSILDVVAGFGIITAIAVMYKGKQL
jgi:hypothetical protein